MVSSCFSEISLKILFQISRPVIIRGKLSFLEPRESGSEQKKAHGAPPRSSSCTTTTTLSVKSNQGEGSRQVRAPKLVVFQNFKVTFGPLTISGARRYD